LVIWIYLLYGVKRAIFVDLKALIPFKTAEYIFVVFADGWAFYISALTNSGPAIKDNEVQLNPIESKQS